MTDKVFKEEDVRILRIAGAFIPSLDLGVGCYDALLPVYDDNGQLVGAGSLVCEMQLGGQLFQAFIDYNTPVGFEAEVGEIPHWLVPQYPEGSTIPCRLRITSVQPTGPSALVSAQGRS